MPIALPEALDGVSQVQPVAVHLFLRDLLDVVYSGARAEETRVQVESTIILFFTIKV